MKIFDLIKAWNDARRVRKLMRQKVSAKRVRRLYRKSHRSRTPGPCVPSSGRNGRNLGYVTDPKPI